MDKLRCCAPPRTTGGMSPVRPLRWRRGPECSQAPPVPQPDSGHAAGGQQRALGPRLWKAGRGSAGVGREEAGGHWTGAPLPPHTLLLQTPPGVFWVGACAHLWAAGVTIPPWVCPLGTPWDNGELLKTQLPGARPQRLSSVGLGWVRTDVPRAESLRGLLLDPPDELLRRHRPLSCPFHRAGAEAAERGSPEAPPRAATPSPGALSLPDVSEGRVACAGVLSPGTAQERARLNNAPPSPQTL